MKKYNTFYIYFLTFIYLEFLYRIMLYDNVLRITNYNMVLFILFLAFGFFLITKLFNEKINKTVFFILIFIVCAWFAAQFVVKDFMDFYISFSVLQIADQAGSFIGKAILETIKRLPSIILLFMPFVIIAINKDKIDFEKNTKKENIITLFMCLAVFFFYYESLYIRKNDDYSAYNLFHDVNNPSINVEKMGVLNTFWVDIYRVLFGFEEKIYITQNDGEIAKDEEYNILDINFDGLIKDSYDTQVIEMSKYLKNERGTTKNEYTAFFEGKNLILFMAESFNEVALKKETMPTLYNMANSSFIFENYYTPTIYSTIGGEFQELTGLYANFTSLSEFREGNNTFPMGLATVFNEKGYNTYAYHNNDYTFQDRNVYLERLGFKNFKGCGNGLEQKIDCNLWPQSDVEMIDATYEDYINNEEPFMVFYASVSGHASYNWNNDMARKHKDQIESLNLKYSEPVKAYLAAQMELDDALELLIKRLDEAGKLDDTVIVLVGDHYPYELTINEINEISEYKKDSVIEVNHSKLVIYNSKTENINISKVGSQIDVIPTIYNLFGIEYDSRLFIGNDILSSEEGLAIFADNSWVSDKGRYYATKGRFKAKEKGIDNSYAKKMNTKVQSKIAMSKYIMDKDYYKLIWPYVN